MQQRLTIGDTLKFSTSVPDYPADDGWTLSFRLVPRVSGTPISFNATADGADYDTEVSATVTAGWTAGEYSWSAYVTLSGESYSVDSGQITLDPDPRTATALDNRSHARKTLAAIEAVIENRATLDQQEYTIGNRSLKRTPLGELIMLRDKYRGEVRAEDIAARVAAGLPAGNQLVYRLTR